MSKFAKLLYAFIVVYLTGLTSCTHEPLVPVAQPYDPLSNTYKMEGVFHMRGTATTGNYHNGDHTTNIVDYVDTISVIAKDSIVLKVFSLKLGLSLISCDTVAKTLKFGCSNTYPATYLSETLLYNYKTHSLLETYSSSDAGSWGTRTASSY